jgi:hypothetical protein
MQLTCFKVYATKLQHKVFLILAQFWTMLLERHLSKFNCLGLLTYQNASKCTDLHIDFHKFPGVDTPGWTPIAGGPLPLPRPIPPRRFAPLGLRPLARPPFVYPDRQFHDPPPLIEICEYSPGAIYKIMPHLRVSIVNSKCGLPIVSCSGLYQSDNLPT